MKVRNFIR